MKKFVGLALAMCLATGVGGVAFGGDAAEPVGEPTLELPTLRSLGFWWAVKGDDNGNAKMTLTYRKTGTEAWQRAPDVWRVEKGRHLNEKGQTSAVVPEGATLFAGSALMLEPATKYELKLTLTDPDGGGVEKLWAQSTIAEPVEPPGMKTVHVVPGNGGGSGTETDPYKGINAAMDAIGPGTILLLHKGVYDGPFVIKKSGEPGKPIIWRGAGDGEALIDGKCPPDQRKGAAIDLWGGDGVERSTKHFWFEDITIANTSNCIRAHGAQDIVVRRVRMRDTICGFFATVNRPEVMKNFFIVDNHISGNRPYPSKSEDWGRPESRGIWIGGMGHVAAYNRLHHLKDGIDTAECIPCAAIDFHNNEISECIDDAVEMDGSERNTRVFLNRMTNLHTALSFQPVYGGPCYAFKNIAYNFRADATKLKNKPSGVVLVHNTFSHMGSPWGVATPAPVGKSFSRNNIFLGTRGPAVFFDPVCTGCDFDFDGFGGWDGPRFMKFNGNYATPEDVKRSGSIQRNHIILDPTKVFASGLQVPTVNPDYDGTTPVGHGTLDLRQYDPTKIDMRLSPDGGAVGVGQKLVGFGDGPDTPPYIGAFAPGEALPHYGPRQKK
ncbi:MAG: right-handed parallel beta-helix repeat-containing protein [Phycisphaerales bacterium]|nr:right-handed parallel beta-helix repeat-containing protein [Phycisphaerales bacterium]